MIVPEDVPAAIAENAKIIRGVVCVPWAVYGTCKQGMLNEPFFPARAREQGWETVERRPLYLADPERNVPFVDDRPGEGHHVSVELAWLPAAMLPELDKFECDYRRIAAAISHPESGKTLHALFYVLDPRGENYAWFMENRVGGPISCYTEEHHRVYRGYELERAAAVPRIESGRERGLER